MIIGYIGKRGSGKTLSMVKYALDKYKKGCNIFTNFGLKFPPSNKAKIEYLDLKFFENYKNSHFNVVNSLVMIDECHIFLDSRNSMCTKNKMLSKFITQTRKRSVDLTYTTQDLGIEYFLTSGQVDLRLRKMTDWFIVCSSYKQAGKIFIVNETFDIAGNMHQKIIFEGDEYFKYFDTDEIIDL